MEARIQARRQNGRKLRRRDADITWDSASGLYSLPGYLVKDAAPAAANVLLVGGGSGHGFKHGPAVGERVAAMVLEQKPADPVFALSRF